MNKHGYDMKEMMNILNKKSGVLGISGVSSDFRDIENAANDGNQRAALALEAFQYSVKKLVGAYAAAMGGVDAIVFTAGVGENDANTRMNIASGLEFMGVKMDAADRHLRRRLQGEGAAHPHRRGAHDRPGHRRHRQGLTLLPQSGFAALWKRIAAPCAQRQPPLAAVSTLGA